MKPLLFILFIVAISTASPKELRAYVDTVDSATIDYGRVALMLSLDAFPDISIEKGLTHFDNLAKGVGHLLKVGKMPEDLSIHDKRVAALNTFFYREGPWNQIGPNQYVTYEYDREFENGDKPEALFLPSLIFENKGTCASLPIMWFVIAKRLQWPVFFTRTPGHLFIKYPEYSRVNIDATVLGGFVPDERYIEDFQISKKALKNGIYLQCLSYKEVVSTWIVNTAVYLVQEKKNVQKAIEYLQLAIDLDPKNCAALSNLSILTGKNKFEKKARKLGASEHAAPPEAFLQRRKVYDEKQQ